MPLVLDESSEPEPGIAAVPARRGITGAVVRRAPGPPSQRLIACWRWVAKSGEYWIVNLRDGRLEIQRDPKGDGYRSLAVLRRGDRVRPHASPDHGVAAADLLP